MKKKWKKGIINIYYIPALVLFGGFVIYPLLKGIQISFTNWDGFSQKYSNVGLRNYQTLLQDGHIRTMLVNTVIYGFGSTLLQNILRLAYALFLNRKFVGRNVTRAVIYMQAMVASLIMGYMYYFILQYDGGALNDIMQALGLEAVDWLSKGQRAVILITLINSIQFVGVSMILYLAGLQGISSSYYEAAELDGAGFWQKFPRAECGILRNDWNLFVSSDHAGRYCIDEVFYEEGGQCVMKKNRTGAKFNISTVIAMLICAFHLIPFYIMIGVAMKSPYDTSSRWVFPGYLYLDNFREAIRYGKIF